MKSPLLAVVVQVATNARDWPPSFPPTDYFAKETKSQYSFLLNVPQREFFCCQVRQLQNQMLYSGNNPGQILQAAA